MTDSEQYTRRKHLRGLTDIYHRSRYGDYEDNYEEFAATYLGSPEMEEDHLVGTQPIPKYASCAEDETYGMIQVFETLPEAMKDQAGIPSNGEYLNVPAGIYDLDTGERVDNGFHRVVLTHDMYATICGLVAQTEGTDVLDGGEAVTHAGIFGPFDELRELFKLDDFRLWARQHDLDAGDGVGYIPHFGE
jgi:hypothetical protein